MTVKLSNEQDEFAVDEDALRRLAELVLAVENADAEAELSVGIVDEARMVRLNETYAGRAGATDVLAFAFDEADDDVEQDTEEPLLLGDVVLCPAVAARNLAEYESTLEQEMALLLVHGVLHLLGHDHADEDGATAMKHREAEILQRFGAGGCR